jgi:hypothetical protein
VSANTLQSIGLRDRLPYKKLQRRSCSVSPDDVDQNTWPNTALEAKKENAHTFAGRSPILPDKFQGIGQWAGWSTPYTARVLARALIVDDLIRRGGAN